VTVVFPLLFTAQPGAFSGRRGSSDLVLTRLHVRYGKDSLGEDLVFRTAAAIVGGREIRDEAGNLEHGATPDSLNNFQARYAIRHPWSGPIACGTPRRGFWGGPPDGGAPAPGAAQKLAFAPRGKLELASMFGKRPRARAPGGRAFHSVRRARPGADLRSFDPSTAAGTPQTLLLLGGPRPVPGLGAAARLLIVAALGLAWERRRRRR